MVNKETNKHRHIAGASDECDFHIGCHYLPAQAHIDAGFLVLYHHQLDSGIDDMSSDSLIHALAGSVGGIVAMSAT